MNTLSVQISTPCLEKWSGIKSAGGGGFCGSCQKTVMDFAIMTDAEVISAMSQRKEGVCGRFRAEQLNRPLRGCSPVSRTPQRFWSLLTAGLLGWYTTPAQVNAPEIKTTKSSAETAGCQQTSIPSPLIASVDSSRIITGRVVAGSDKNNLPNVSVLMQGVSQGVATDTTGHFQLVIPIDYALDSVMITVSYLGFLRQKVSVNLSQQEPLLISLVEYTNIMGEAAVVELPKKPSFLDQLRNRFPAAH